MSLMAIILWALHALSPLRRLQESARHLLHTLLTTLADPRWPDWLEANPDDPQGFPMLERMLDNLDASIDALIYQKARQHLGLRSTWKTPRQLPLQRRRSRSFADLFSRLEATTLRFSDIDRLAQRRAEKLQRLLTKHPDALLPRAGEAQHALTAHHASSGGGKISLWGILKPTTLFVPHRLAHAPTSAHASLPRSGEEAGLRVRAPP